MIGMDGKSSKMNNVEDGADFVALTVVYEKSEENASIEITRHRCYWKTTLKTKTLLLLDVQYVTKVTLTDVIILL